MRSQLIDLSVALLGRAPSETELFHWYQQEIGVGALTVSLLDSGSAAERFDMIGGDEALLASAYDSLFGREPDAEGLAYWLEKLDSGELPRDLLVPTLLAGARAETGDARDAALLDKRLEEATSYLAEVESGALTFNEQAAAQRVSDVTRDSVTVPPVDEPGEGVPVELQKGSVVANLEKTSVDGAAGSSVVSISEQELDVFDSAFMQLVATANENHGSLITFSTGSDVLELVTIDFVGVSDLRDLAREVGYEDFIDMAIYNGELVTAESLGLDPQTFFSETDIPSEFGYDWPWVESGPEVVTRADGADFSVEVELFDSLGVANLDELFDAIA